MSKSSVFVFLSLLVGVTSPNLMASDHDPAMVQDPAIYARTLDNGLRYVIMPNKRPEGTASIRLYFNIGSLAEREHEQGFAHFVEHMAFNGSANVPEGELVKILQRAGLAFGADVNASTSFENTIYKLELPNVDEKTITTSLMLMRETASNLSFDPGAIDREKGVLLSELDAGDTTGLEIYRKQLRFWAPEVRANHRFAIGTKATIAAATSETLSAFYNDFYRPKNALLVFVGDIEIEDIDEQINSHFSDWKNETPLRDTGYLAETRDIFPPTDDLVQYYTKEGVSSSLSISYFSPYVELKDTKEDRTNSFKKALANFIFNQRLAKLTRMEGTPFVGAQAGQQALYKEKNQSILYVSSTDEQILAAIPVVEQELRRLLEFGFNQAELTQYIANFRASLDHAVTNADTRPNSHLAGAIIGGHHAELTVLHPKTQLKLFEEMAAILTPIELSNIFRSMWAGENFKYFVTSSRAIENLDTSIAEAVTKSRQVAVDAPIEEETGTFAYTDFGTSGKIRTEIAEEETEKKSAFTKIRFENGVMLNMMRTEWEDNTVRMRIRLEGGYMSFPKEQAGLQNLANIVFINGGLKAHTIDDINRIIAGKTISANLSTSATGYSMSNAVASKDILAQLQLWAAYLTSPAFRPETYSLYTRAISAAFQSPRSSPGRALSREIGKYLYGGDPRFFLQSEEHLNAFTIDELKQAMAYALSTGAIEISLVGDIDMEQVKADIAATFGALPSRAEIPTENEALNSIKFNPETNHVTIRHQGKINQATLKMYWPTDDGKDVILDSKLELLAEVMSIKLRDLVREDAGLSYSPGVGSYTSPIFEGYGTFNMSTDVTPNEIAQAERLFLETIVDIKTNLVDDDLLERARKPILENIALNKKLNGYWLSYIQQAQTTPERMVFKDAYATALEKVTAEHLKEIANTYLRPDTLFKVHVLHDDVNTEIVLAGGAK